MSKIDIKNDCKSDDKEKMMSILEERKRQEVPYRKYACIKFYLIGKVWWEESLANLMNRP